ncbi:gliding motility lipoprotein GldD [Sphingobacterium hungaricum]|uniref:Gliding motility lipoprotein GldD n=1 Tax=Sphingobacterium hungaricum TaxID=2082723 RepID=A0A928UWX1_9SPHI|nr:gliding motility lipoprotein GldD [Sphingobacterium hungaricum]MBE8714202.1 gliding motility lipoprotein GldD [Sphingobacterium hungaricum]
MLLLSCGQADFSPKPRGYYRIDLPQKIYQVANTGCPFSFEIPTYSNLKDDTNKGAQPCWKNLEFPQFNAILHISYFDINQQTTFDQLTEDARTFVFKHTSKASAIDQKPINIPETSVYGLQYDIKGNTASNTQFYVSDSSRHYLRAALYFNEKPNIDSIQPVLNFLKQDIETLINTLSWK